MEGLRLVRRTMEFGDVRLEVAQRASPSATQDHLPAAADDDCVRSGDDSTGLDLWPAGEALAAYLSAHTSSLLVSMGGLLRRVGARGKTLKADGCGACGSQEEREWVELGAGVGVPGMLAATLGVERVTLTDFDPNVSLGHSSPSGAPSFDGFDTAGWAWVFLHQQALRLLHHNIQLNVLEQRCTVTELDFRSPATLRREAFGVALGADILCTRPALRLCCSLGDSSRVSVRL